MESTLLKVFHLISIPTLPPSQAKMSSPSATVQQVLAQIKVFQDQQTALIKSLISGDMPSAASVASKPSRKGKGVKRGPTGASLFFKHVHAALVEASPGEKFPLAAVHAEIKRRKELNQYDEAYWKAQAAAAKVTASSSATESDAESETASTESKKRGRPKGSKNKVAATEAEPSTPAKPTKPKKADAPKKAAPPPPPPSDDEDDDEEDSPLATEWEHRGTTYFKSLDNEVWECNDGAPGKMLGIYNPLKNKIVPQ